MAQSLEDIFTGLTAGTEELKQQEGISWKDFSSVSLAYLGDAVYSLLIRTLVLSSGNTSVDKMHRRTSAFVEARAQSAMMQVLQDQLTEEELGVYRRGRNAHSGSVPKNQSMSDYRRATGFEALLGYLYLEGKTDRIYELLEMGLPWITKN